MNMNDARVKHTRNAIRENFLLLLQKKPVSRITVKEICERCQINRTTFYKHYADPLDVLEKLEADMLASLRRSLEPPMEDTRAFLDRILAGMQGHADIYLILASENGDPALPAKVFACCYELVFPRFASRLPGLTPAQQDMAYQYLAQGSGGVLSWWMRSGMAEPRENVVELLLALTAQTTGALPKREADAPA